MEVGCGLALASLVGHKRGADVTASECHPLAGVFMHENLRINGLLPLQNRYGRWGALPAYDGSSAPIAAGPPKLIPPARMGVAAPVQGRFGLIMGSDILHERDKAGKLPAFIEEHTAHACEVWVVGPNRDNRAHFHRHWAALGFVLKEYTLTLAVSSAWAAYKGRMLRYLRN